MTVSRLPGRSAAWIIGLGTLLVLALLVSGCTQQASTPPGTQITPSPPEGTPASPAAVVSPAPADTRTTAAAEGGKKMVTFTESDNGKTGTITQNTRFAIELAENPTTGFMWNATLSPGLELQSTDFRQSPAAPGMTGVGGTRTWIVIAKDTGDQKFSASYRRSWENVTGSETGFNVTIQVVKA